MYSPSLASFHMQLLTLFQNMSEMRIDWDMTYNACRGGAEVDVKRLPKRPAPPRFGRKLTESQKASMLQFT